MEQFIIKKTDYQWDFSLLYHDHKAWKKDLDSLALIVQKIVALKGQLHVRANFDLYHTYEEELNVKLEKLVLYLHYGDLNTTDETFVNLSNLFSVKTNNLYSLLTFIDPELIAIGEEQITSWIQELSHLSKFNYRYRHLFKTKQHILKPELEKMLANISQSRSLAFQMYDSLAFADKKPITFTYQGKKQTLTPATLLQVLQWSDPVRDQKLRYQINLKYNKHIIDKKHSFANLYQGVLQVNQEDVKIRNYSSVLAMALSGDDVSEKLYLNLIKFTRQHTSLVSEYEAIKCNHWKLERYYSTDASLKLADLPKIDYSVDESKTIIRAALKPLGSDYADYLEKAWSKNRVDYYASNNKRSGAYSAGGGSVAPIILMNWDNTLNSVNTLAHEIGHSVHTLFAQKHQPYPLYHYPIILAEVASTLNEHLLFDHLLTTTEDPQFKIYLLQNRIDELIGTFFRQVCFAEFEYSMHQRLKNNEPLTAKAMADFFYKLSKIYNPYPFAKQPSSAGRYSWPRISHFFHSPFYVYKYATSVVASFKFYQEIKNGNVENYISFLKEGGSKEPLTILKDHDVNFDEDNLYQILIKYTRNLIKTLAALLK